MAIVACKNGSVNVWDIEGPDAGEMTAQLRSLQPQEIILPIALLIVSTLQVMCFAFSKHIKWDQPAQDTAKSAEGVVSFELFEMLEDLKAVHFGKTDLFWYKTKAAMCLMAFVV